MTMNNAEAVVGLTSKSTIEIEIVRVSCPSLVLLGKTELIELPVVSEYSRNGVYFLWKQAELLYVGQSVNIWDRMYQHGRTPKLASYDKATWLYVDWPWHLAFEAAYIKELKPPMNGFADIDSNGAKRGNRAWMRTR